jgi:hypothetical protein
MRFPEFPAGNQEVMQTRLDLPMHHGAPLEELSGLTCSNANYTLLKKSLIGSEFKNVWKCYRVISRKKHEMPQLF